jgi:hypothetical protein
MTVPKYEDYPIDELAVTLYRAMQEGAIGYMKFTCMYCGSRQTIDVPNRLFTQGKCEVCKSVTNLEKTGGNLLLVAPLNDAANDLLHKINEEFK